MFLSRPSPSPTSTSSGDSCGANIPRRKTRVSAEHTLNRVRENQRRHRARQRDHMASLELKLAETEKQLAEARKEIASLRAERENRRTFFHQDQSLTPDQGPDFPTSIMDMLSPFPGLSRPDVISSNNSASQLYEPLAQLGGTLSPGFIIDLEDAMSEIPPSTLPEANGPPPCCSDTAVVSSVASSADPECSNCKTRPPPSPSESTTLCAQAFVLISQQNFRNLDPGTIRLWLAQGLRRAQRQGEGCRVENGALLSLLDYISGPK